MTPHPPIQASAQLLSRTTPCDNPSSRPYFVGPSVYLITALYFSTLFLTLPESLGGLVQGVVVIVLAIKVAQVLQGFAAYGIRKGTEQTAKKDPAYAVWLDEDGPVFQWETTGRKSTDGSRWN